MKKKKLTSTLYFVASVCFFIAAGIGYSNDNSMATVWICLGATMFCLGSAALKKTKDKQAKENEEK